MQQLKRREIRMHLASGRRGFTLIEIMIVVAVLGLLAAIAVPGLMRARMNANEGAVKPDLRNFSSACESFRAAQNPPAYPEDIDALTTSTPSYLDATWGEAQVKHGFTMSYLGAESTYSLLATAVPGAAFNNYCIDQTGVVVTGDGIDATDAGCGDGTPIGG